MKLFKCMLILLLLFFCFASARGAEFYIVETPIIDNVKPGDFAKFNLTIVNNQSFSDTFIAEINPLYIFPFDENIADIRATPKEIYVGAGKTATIGVEVKLGRKVETKKFYSTHRQAFSIKSKRTGEAINHQFTIRALSPDEIISINIKKDLGKVSPGENLMVEFALLNNLNTHISNIELLIDSELFKEKKVIHLFPFQERKESFSFPIKDAKPGEYQLSVRAFVDGELSGKATSKFYVTSQARIVESIEIKQSFFKKELVLKRTNIGNQIAQSEYKMNFSFFEKMFTKSNVEPKVKDNELTYVFVINPGETFILHVKTDFRPILYIIMLAIIATITFYFIITHKVRISKELIKIRKTGDKIEFKILLFIKNNTRSSIKNIQLTEFVPNYVKVVSFETLKPIQTEKGKNLTRMIWNIGELVKGEERIISYKGEIETKFIGRLSLPQATLKYKNIRNKVCHIKSNRVVIPV